jgi:hypothetical protein
MSPSYIKSKGERLKNIRNDIFPTPRPMLKLEAYQWMLSHPSFQSPEDQELIQEQIYNRTPQPKKKRGRPPTAKIDSLTSRERNNIGALDLLKSLEQK